VISPFGGCDSPFGSPQSHPAHTPWHGVRPLRLTRDSPSTHLRLTHSLAVHRPARPALRAVQRVDGMGDRLSRRRMDRRCVANAIQTWEGMSLHGGSGPEGMPDDAASQWRPWRSALALSRLLLLQKERKGAGTGSPLPSSPETCLCPW